MRVVLVSAAFSAIAGLAAAQEEPRLIEQQEKLTYEPALFRILRPEGIRGGGLNYFPGVETSLGFDSNVFTSDREVGQDARYRLAPSLGVTSNWSRHQFQFFAQPEVGVHALNRKQDYVDADVETAARIEIDRRTDIRPLLRFERDHFARGDLLESNDPEPSTRNRYTANLQARRALGRMAGIAEAQILRADFEIPDGGDPDRFDLVETSGLLRAEYRDPGGLGAFVRGRARFFDYDNENGGVDQDRRRVEGDVGIIFFKNQNFEGEAYIGILDIDAKDDRVQERTTYGLGSQLLWRPTPRVQWRLNTRRTERISTGGISPVLETVGRIDFRRALTAHQVFRAEAGVAAFDFFESDRDDLRFDVGVGYEWAVTRRLALDLDYGFRRYKSDVGSESFSQHQVQAGFRFAY